MVIAQKLAEFVVLFIPNDALYKYKGYWHLTGLEKQSKMQHLVANFCIKLNYYLFSL